MYYSYVKYLPANRSQKSPTSPTIHDGQDDGNGIGANVRVALQVEGHLPQHLGKHHGKFYAYWNVALLDIYSVG
jgi:hypothetical protein